MIPHLDVVVLWGNIYAIYAEVDIAAAKLEGVDLSWIVDNRLPPLGCLYRVPRGDYRIQNNKEKNT